MVILVRFYRVKRYPEYQRHLELSERSPRSSTVPLRGGPSATLETTLLVFNNIRRLTWIKVGF